MLTYSYNIEQTLTHSGLDSIASTFLQEGQVEGLSSGISLSKIIGGKTVNQSPLPNPTKVGVLCINYDLYKSTCFNLDLKLQSH